MLSLPNRLRVGVIFCACSVAPVSAQTRAEIHVELRATIEQWMQAVDKSQELENQWELERTVLADSISGLAGMLQQAEVEIEAVQKRLEAANVDSQEKLQEQKEYNEAREVLRKGLSPVEDEVAKVIPLIPEFYIGGEGGSPKLKSSIEALEKHRKAGPEEKEKVALNTRIQPLAQILTEAERFNSKLWAVAHPLQVGKLDKEMNVLYFGLSVAFAVDDAGTVALEGHSTPEGWVFKEMEAEGVAEQVLTLYKSADGSGESLMVDLPLTLD